ncbi:GNAT family acetyltransferase, putative [Talaromyces marneffei ATCC 18224]|uniref:GNAT family acetyltransferase, putative n=1 Tax=Talaromyces marneffei (strain ATCC 18224 / CBS 334.59 / QM 7333) TaxID=441960 RepID=B6QIS5_TALMQ|nr:GNAT family acetyltransferase, putative [Talaromyces marneffei ATCC 18224]
MEESHTGTFSSNNLNKRITIRPAIVSDIQYLPAIEESASEIFNSISDLKFIAADPPLSTDMLHSFLTSDHLWVATTREDKSGTEIPVAFLAAKCITPVRRSQRSANNNNLSEHLYIVECSVHLSFQRQGMAGRMLSTIADYACEHGFGWLTLITFLDVPWNGRFYQRHGFEEVEAAGMGDEYVEILREELDQWKDWNPHRWRRGVMARKL